MECPSCGVEVSEGQKFCHECGSSLDGVTNPTEPLDVVPGDDAASPAEPQPTDDDTRDLPVIAPPDAIASAAAAATTTRIDAPPADPDQEATVPTGPPPDDDPAATKDVTTVPTGPPPSDDFAATTVIPTGPPPSDDAAITTVPTGPPPTDDAAITTVPTGPPPSDDFAATTIIPASPPAADAAPTPPSGVADVDTTRFEPDPATATTVIPATGGVITDEYPAVFDGGEHVAEYPPGREPFEIKLTFVLAFLGAATMVMSTVADLIDIRTSIPVDRIAIGPVTLQDVGVNLPEAGYAGAAAMVIGGFIACWSLRWGAGIAGGSGLALAGWAGLTIGLLEVRIAIAQSITRTSTEQFTLTVTRDIGYWLVIAAGAMGAIVFAASLRSAGTGGRPSLNPWIAAVGAVSAVVLSAGPLIPVGDEARFADNFRSTNALIDLPTAYFGGRIGQLALIAFAGVVGFLLVRAYGLGLAAGGITVGFYLWLTSLLGVGEDLVTGEQPLGIAAGNFGAPDTEPHIVTTIGMVAMLLSLVAATALAIVQWRRQPY